VKGFAVQMKDKILRIFDESRMMIAFENVKI
jgi:hypothetical protein